jgi:hypothetical protein
MANVGQDLLNLAQSIAQQILGGLLGLLALFASGAEVNTQFTSA